MTPRTTRRKPGTPATAAATTGGVKRSSGQRPSGQRSAGQGSAGTRASGRRAFGKASATARRRSADARRRRRTITVTAVVTAVVVLAVVGLYGIYRAASGGGSGQAGKYPHAVGQPGPGATAPGFTLASTAGGSQTLAALRGKTVLLYFQEGLSCQPCFDQLTDLQQHAKAVRAAGIEQVLSITTDPIALLSQKTRDMNLTIPVLSDPDLAVSGTYHANQYGMMGTSRDGHTFILVRPDGTIGWRADYGGSPKYTMFVPTADLLADLHARAAR